MCNAQVKKKMHSTGVRQWQIAEYLGISEATMCRKMRVELDPDFRNKVIAAIEAICDLPANGAAKIDCKPFEAVIEK